MRAALLLLALLVLGACGDDAPEVPIELSQGEMEVRTLVPPTFRATYPEAANLVIRDPVAYLKLWNVVAAEMTPLPAPPPAHFDREMVLAIFLGPGPAGRAVGVRGVERVGDEIVVRYGTRERVSGGAERRSGPCVIVAVPRSDLAVVWSREEN